MRVIIGYGNSFRGEDGFGVEVIRKLEKFPLDNTRLISLFQLTPEIVLDLLDAEEIVFVDATYSQYNHYALACTIKEPNSRLLSHHISPYLIIEILQHLYQKNPKYQFYSMFTDSFDSIVDEMRYNEAIQAIAYSLTLHSS